MFQLKYENGIDLCVIGKGENGLSRIDDRNGKTVLTAGYDECIEWLEARKIKVATLQNRAYPTGGVIKE